MGPRRTYSEDHNQKQENALLVLAGNYSVAGFELTLHRKVYHYVITYYLPSGMFVIVSW